MSGAFKSFFTSTGLDGTTVRTNSSGIEMTANIIRFERIFGPLVQSFRAFSERSSHLRVYLQSCHTPYMPSRARTRGGKRADFAQVAVSIVEQAIGDVLKPAEGKNPHAQALSALGASKGGKARAANLSPKRRREIAKQAAAKRWGKG